VRRIEIEFILSVLMALLTVLVVVLFDKVFDGMETVSDQIVEVEYGERIKYPIKWFTEKRKLGTQKRRRGPMRSCFGSFK
jgi:hypothetical protein